MCKGYPLAFLVLVLSLSACASDFDKAMNSTDKALRYQAGTAYYQKGKYDKAAELLESIQKSYVNSPQLERIDYFLADSYFQNRHYVSAAYYFERFYKAFPRSAKAEKAAYLAAVCQDAQSPYFELDQTPTRKAIDAYQYFIDTYPNSDSVAVAGRRIDALTDKLERKRFAIGKLYFKMMDYRAAEVSIENFLDDYPDTALRRAAMETLFKTSYELAMNSISSLKEERLVESQTAYRRLVEIFPQTPMREEADKKKSQIDAELIRVRKQQAELRESKEADLHRDKG
ncbi:MAG: outer membrane protein assembly factor BamD [Flavobacteriales bacterium]